MSRVTTRILASAGAAGVLSLALATPASAVPCAPGQPNYPPGCTTDLTGNGGGNAGSGDIGGNSGNGGGNASGNGGGLPFTGFELGATVLIGAGLLGAGALTIVSGRKRKEALA